MERAAPRDPCGPEGPSALHGAPPLHPHPPIIFIRISLAIPIIIYHPYIIYIISYNFNINLISSCPGSSDLTLFYIVFYLFVFISYISLPRVLRPYRPTLLRNLTVRETVSPPRGDPDPKMHEHMVPRHGLTRADAPQISYDY